jgi:hypothetical protein
MMPGAAKQPMQQSVVGSLAAMLFCLLLSTGLCAQTDKDAEEVAASIAICKDTQTDAEEQQGEEKLNQYRPCEQYIDATIDNNADTVKWLLEQIDIRQDSAKDISNDYYRNDQILQMIVIFLSLFTTISAAVTKLYPKLNVAGIDFALAPIVLSAMIAAVTSINAYYQFYQYSTLSQNMADELSELEADIHFLIHRHVAGQSQMQVNDDIITEWQSRLKTILQRYSQRETGNGV